MAEETERLRLSIKTTKDKIDLEVPSDYTAKQVRSLQIPSLPTYVADVHGLFNPRLDDGCMVVALSLREAPGSTSC